MLSHIVCIGISKDTGGAPTVTTERTTANSAARIVRLDAEAVRASVRVVGLAGPEDLARMTPCAGWTLGDLVAHMTAQHDGFAAAAAGEGADLARWQRGGRAGDAVGGDEGGGGRGGPRGVRRRRRTRPGVHAAGDQPGAALPRAPGDRLPLHRLRGARLG